MGARIAVAEAARNVACTGARPRAITNNLNFGNPRKPETYFQLREAVAGIAEACLALETPVTGGNVSLYNENPAGAVYPTPVIGMVGVIDSIEQVTRSTFTMPGDEIVLLGTTFDEIGGSEYLARVHGVVAGAPPRCDLDAERKLIAALLEAIQSGRVRSAHDCSDGGFAVALAECCIIDRDAQFGASVDLRHLSIPVKVSPKASRISTRGLLFGESQARVIVSTNDSQAVLAAARKHGLSTAMRIGVVTVEKSLSITTDDGTLSARLSDLDDDYFETIPRIMSKPAVAEPS